MDTSETNDKCIKSLRNQRSSVLGKDKRHHPEGEQSDGLVDVILMFNSPNVDLSEKITKELLQAQCRGKALKSWAIYKQLEIGLYTCFEFNGDMYEQIRGTPMRSRNSELLDDIYIYV